MSSTEAAALAMLRLGETANHVLAERDRCLELVEANADDIAEASDPMARREALRQLVDFIRDGVVVGQPRPFDGRVRT